MKNLLLGIAAFRAQGAGAATKALELDKGCRCGLQQRRIEFTSDRLMRVALRTSKTGQSAHFAIALGQPGAAEQGVELIGPPGR